MINKYLFIVVGLIFSHSPLCAISLYADKEQVDRVYFSDTNALYFNFGNNNFLWNNEYFNDVVSGYTLIGYNITPTLNYHFTPNIKAELGVHLLKYSGIKAFSKVLPRYAIVYHKNKMSFTMGALYSGAMHHLNDIVYNYERNFTHYQENGVQFRLDKDRLFLDVWLDWQTFIFRGDEKQEELVAGISIIPTVIQTERWMLSTPAYFLVTHKGGQINEGDQAMLTAYNYGLGINVKTTLSSTLLSDISFETQYHGFTDNSPQTVSIYKQGSGLMSNIKLHHDKSFFQIGYWKANKYLSLIGNPIYQCFSDKGELFHQSNRELLTTQLYYGKQLFKGIDLGIMGETFYDVKDGFFDYSMGVKITVRANIFLTKVRTSKL